MRVHAVAAKLFSRGSTVCVSPSTLLVPSSRAATSMMREPMRGAKAARRVDESHAGLKARPQAKGRDGGGVPVWQCG